MTFEIVQASELDYDTLGQILYRSVREGQSPYTETQRQAWCPEPRSGQVWDERLSSQYILKAVQTDSGQAVGFASLLPDHYVDFAYILPEARGRGLFRKFLNGLEIKARSQRATELTTHASLMAMPAFRATGFEILDKESILIGTISLDRYSMRKSL